MSTYLYSAFGLMFLSYQVRVLAETFALREKCLKYGVFSSPYFFVFTTNTGKLEPEKNPYLDNFQTVLGSLGKWQTVCLRIKWVWVRFPLRPLKLQISIDK